MLFAPNVCLNTREHTCKSEHVRHLVGGSAERSTSGKFDDFSRILNRVIGERTCVLPYSLGHCIAVSLNCRIVFAFPACFRHLSSSSQCVNYLDFILLCAQTYRQNLYVLSFCAEGRFRFVSSEAAIGIDAD